MPMRSTQTSSSFASKRSESRASSPFHPDPPWAHPPHATGPHLPPSHPSLLRDLPLPFPPCPHQGPLADMPSVKRRDTPCVPLPTPPLVDLFLVSSAASVAPATSPHPISHEEILTGGKGFPPPPPPP
eukprot:Sspe_Gene.18152::Locus_6502_Transcript_1_1_Confidence_1.000_Length_519::g.18152::m.18152